jgi:hypothetical protein
MPKYLIAWTEEDWYNVTIEADSSQNALDIFYGREYDEHTIVHIGGELQDSVEVEEL